MASVKSFTLCLLTCLFFHSHAATALPQDYTAPNSSTVTLKAGVVVGKQTSIPNRPSNTVAANAYLGIPFAKSPPERFSPPEAAQAWPSPLLAQAVKPACIQQFSPILGIPSTGERTEEFFNNPGFPPPEESEDCLYLNVWTPPDVTPASKKPVLFWIFGGNFAFGYGGAPYYDRASLSTTQDVVVVTINYRTNIFGFSNSPDLPLSTQNAGLLDQRFALKWVTDNIANFGGDPAKVTIFGESAGGESVKQLLANPPSPLPFSAAILQSQQATTTPATGQANYNQTLSHFGCVNIDCLRRVPALDLKAYIEDEGLAFAPVEDPATFRNDVRPAIRSGSFADVPILMGTNLNEVRVFLGVLGLTNGADAVGQVLSALQLNDTLGQTLIAEYTANGVDDLYAIADRIGTDTVFACPTATLASFLNFYRYRVHRYRYDASFASTEAFPGSGAYHSSEIPEVFGTYPLPATQQQINLSAHMQKLWANFAKGRAPSWPQIGSGATVELGVLGKDGSSSAQVLSTLQSDYSCALLSPVADLIGLSY